MSTNTNTNPISKIIIDGTTYNLTNLGEQQRVTNENSRLNNEGSNDPDSSYYGAGRCYNQRGRISAETSRVSAQSGRVSAQTSRVNAQTARTSAQSGRASAESDRVENQSTRQTKFGQFNIASSYNSATHVLTLTTTKPGTEDDDPAVTQTTTADLTSNVEAYRYVYPSTGTKEIIIEMPYTSDSTPISANTGVLFFGQINSDSINVAEWYCNITLPKLLPIPQANTHNTITVEKICGQRRTAGRGQQGYSQSGTSYNELLYDASEQDTSKQIFRACNLIWDGSSKQIVNNVSSKYYGNTVQFALRPTKAIYWDRKNGNHWYGQQLFTIKATYIRIKIKQQADQLSSI